MLHWTASPVVSVLMTAFNRSRFIEESVRSVQSSAYERWELIVVDDASCDSTLDIVRRLAADDERITVVANERNLGDYPNRNRAAALARGRYLKYLDSDDRISREGLGIMVESMERFPQSALGVCDMLDAQKQTHPFVLTPHDVYWMEFLGRGVLGVGPTGTIIRRDAFEEASGFRVSRWLGDWDMWLYLASRAPVVVMEPDLVWWRVHQGQEITSAGAARFYLERGYEVATAHLDSEKCPLGEDERNRARVRLKQHHARRLLRMILCQREIREGYDAFRASGLTWRELLRGLLPYQEASGEIGHKI